MAGSAPKSLRRLALPLILSFTLRNLFSLVDLGFASSLENSRSAVAAIGYWIPFQMFYIAIWVGLSAGLTATLSQAFGLPREDLLAGLRGAILRILIVLVVVLICFGISLRFLVPLLSLEEDLTRDFTIYGSILAIGFPITGFWSILPDSIVKAHHDTRSTMIAGLLSTGTNAALNATFVFVFGWGLAGIALGTVLARIPSLIYATARARALERQRVRDWAGDAPVSEEDAARMAYSEGFAIQLAKPVRRIFVLGLPSTFAFVLTAGEASFVNALLTRLPESTAMIASWGVFNALLQVSIMPIVGSAVAVLPWLARLAPTGRFEGVRSEFAYTALLCAGLSVVLTILPAFVFTEAIARQVLQKEGSVDARSPQLAIDALRLLPLVPLAALPFILLRTSFEALNQPRIAIVASLMRFFVLSYPMLYLGRHIGLTTDLGPIRGMVLGLCVAALIASLFVSAALNWKLRRLQQP